MRKYDVKALLGEDFEFELSPSVLAYEVAMDFSSQVVLYCDKNNIKLKKKLRKKLDGRNLTFLEAAEIAVALNCDLKCPRLVPLD